MSIARNIRVAGSLAAAILTSVLLASTALAEAPGKCPTWLPDLHCDRTGRWQGWSPPTSTPYLFEDPFITTGATAHYVHHRFPNNSALQGGYVDVYALQLRVALTDRLALIATQDGFTVLDPGLKLIDNATGFMDIMAGIKYALIEDRERGVIVTPSLRFQIPVGNREVLQRSGNGIFLPGLHAGFGDGSFHVMGSMSFELPVDMDANSTLVHYGMQLDYMIKGIVAPFFAVNAFSYLASGDGQYPISTSAGKLSLSQTQTALGTGAFEGLDYMNFGSSDVTGETIATLAVGTRVQVTDRVNVGASYEFPLTNAGWITRDRVTANVSFDF